MVKRFLRVPEAAFFTEPVPDDVPLYHEVIERPMDLGTVSAALAEGAYSSLGAPMASALR